MQTIKQQRRALVEDFMKRTGQSFVDLHEVARDLISRGVKPPEPRTPESLLAEKLAEAMREDTGIDEVTKRPYKKYIAVREWRGGEQYSIWGELETAPRRIADRNLKQRREQTIGDVLSIADDADHWNRINPDEEPLQMPLDFTLDINLRRIVFEEAVEEPA